MTFRVTFWPLWDANIQDVHSSSTSDQATRPRECCKHELAIISYLGMLDYQIGCWCIDKVEQGQAVCQLLRWENVDKFWGNQEIAMAEHLHGCSPLSNVEYF